MLDELFDSLFEDLGLHKGSEGGHDAGEEMPVTSIGSTKEESFLPSFFPFFLFFLSFLSLSFFFSSLFFETGSQSVAQAGVQWPADLVLLSAWDCRCATMPS